MRILVAGAGIAGNTLAFWLSKLGHDITVIERHGSLRTNGLQIDVRGCAISVLKWMGLDEAFKSNAIPETGVQFVDSAGKRRAWFPATKGPQSFTAEYEIMRGDLVHLLYDATKHRVKYLFGTSIQRYEEKDEFLKVDFSDGTTDKFDLLVGADGQNSQTRKMLMGSDSSNGFYPLDDVVAYYRIPKPVGENEEYIATVYVGTKNRSMMVRRSNPKELLVYVGAKMTDERMKHIRRGDIKAQKEAFRNIYKSAGWKTEELLDAADDSSDFYCEQVGLVKLDAWHKGRVALVGDAAYCPSPNTGVGTTSGILGAYILAGEIGKHCGRGDSAGEDHKQNGAVQLGAALKAYDEAFRPFITHAQKGVLENNGWGLPTSALGISIMHIILNAASALRIDVLGKMMIKNSPKGWKVPDYQWNLP